MTSWDSSFFTRRPAARHFVPHEALGERWLLVIHVAVTAAFSFIRQRGFDLRSAGENEITNRLEHVLMNDVLNRDIVGGFDRLFFGPVTRGSEVENYNGIKISKKPDLIFHLQRENVLWDRCQDGVFGECKPVDRKHSLAANYCAVGTARVGIERFVIGDYAWAMQEALMIGYVREGFHIFPHLAAELAAPRKHKALGLPTEPVVVPSDCDHVGREPLHLTIHLRSFVWKQTGEPASPIAIYHSWHDCE